MNVSKPTIWIHKRTGVSPNYHRSRLDRSQVSSGLNYLESAASQDVLLPANTDDGKDAGCHGNDCDVSVGGSTSGTNTSFTGQLSGDHFMCIVTLLHLSVMAETQ